MEKKVRKMPRNTKYNKKWEDKVVNDDKVGTWCQKETDTSAKCLPCRKVIDISNKGFSALRVHAGNRYNQNYVSNYSEPSTSSANLERDSINQPPANFTNKTENELLTDQI